METHPQTVAGQAAGRAHYSRTGAADPVDLVDHGAAQAAVAVVENHVLPRRHGALRVVEADCQRRARALRHHAALVGLAIADLGCAPEAVLERGRMAAPASTEIMET